MAPAQQLPTYCKFLVILESSQPSVSTLPSDSRDCTICLEPLRDHTRGHPDDSDDQVEQHRPVKLSCEHYFGFDCISEWCQTHNNCPLCRQELFQDLEWAHFGHIRICTNDDMVNLRGIMRYCRRILDMQETDESESEDQSLEDLMTDWRNVVYRRARLYYENRLSPETTAYREYVRRPTKLYERHVSTVSKRHKVDCQRLHKMIQDDYEALFLKECLRSNCRPIVPHPFGTLIFYAMMKGLRDDLQDTEISATELQTLFELYFDRKLKPFMATLPP